MFSEILPVYGQYINVFLLVVITFVSDPFSRLLINYFVFMSFFAYGDSIGLEIFRVPAKNCSCIFSIWIAFVSGVLVWKGWMW